jgi:squalene synthase HpnC
MTRENFPVALRALPGRLRHDLLAIYRWARYVDDVGDETTEDATVALKALAVDVQQLYDGQRAATPQVEGLRSLVHRHAVPVEPWLSLVEANLVDQQVTRYATFTDLVGYCALSADPVGRLVLHVFDAATPDRLELSDRVCTGLQLVEHWQDLREDYSRGRVYLPQEDLELFAVPEHALGAARATPDLRDLVRYETDRALAWLDAGAPLVSTLHGWARLSVSGYLNGGRAAAAGLRRAGYDPLPGVAKPTGVQVARSWATATLRSPG